MDSVGACSIFSVSCRFAGGADSGVARLDVVAALAAAVLLMIRRN
jgi:hypothetical protein